MTIQYEVSDLLNVTSGIIVHGCNNIGIMGGGVAAAIKEKYPKCFNKYYSFYDGYKEAQDTMRRIQLSGPFEISCEQYSDAKDILHCHPKLGDVIYWSGDNQLLIANGITQEAFNLERNTDYDAVDAVFENVFNHARNIDLLEIHIPLIGSGIGGGCWKVIESIIEDRSINHEYRLPGDPIIKTIVHCMTKEDIPNWAK